MRLTRGARVLTAMLQEVVQSGGPAQTAYALELIEQLESGADADAMRPDVERLVDAFRHDPYVWR